MSSRSRSSRRSSRRSARAATVSHTGSLPPLPGLRHTWPASAGRRRRARRARARGRALARGARRGDRLGRGAHSGWAARSRPPPRLEPRSASTNRRRWSLSRPPRARSSLSPFHFLRVFRVCGNHTTQYLLHTRLRHARASASRDAPKVADLPYDVGFGDLLTSCARSAARQASRRALPDGREEPSRFPRSNRQHLSSLNSIEVSVPSHRSTVKDFAASVLPRGAHPIGPRAAAQDATSADSARRHRGSSSCRTRRGRARAPRVSSQRSSVGEPLLRRCVAAGGKDNGAPAFARTTARQFYASFLLDPDGNNVEAVCLAQEK